MRTEPAGRLHNPGGRLFMKKFFGFFLIFMGAFILFSTVGMATRFDLSEGAAVLSFFVFMFITGIGITLAFED